MKRDKTIKVVNKGGPVGGTLFLAWIGALVYFVQHSQGFGGFLVAVIKACVWPAFVVHSALKLLKL